MIGILLSLVISLLFFTVYFITKRNFQYWKKKKVPHVEPVAVLGNFSRYILQKQFLGHTTQELLQRFPNAPYIGTFYGTEPALLVQDPDHIKLVMTKDFYFFSGREASMYSQRELLMQNLFSTSGDEWKVLRQNLTPLFSSAKMKNMFHLIEKCSHAFENMLDKEFEKSNEIEVRDAVARFTMDCIGNCAFGVETHTMAEVENNPFRKIAETIFDTHYFRAFKLVARAIWPAIFYALGFKAFPKEIDNFFINLMTKIFKGRQYTPTTRNDFVDFMLKFKNNKLMTGDSLTNLTSDSGKKVQLEVDDDLMIAQCFLFFAAGFETSATTLGFTLYELAKNPEAQERVLEEIDEYLRCHDNKLKYECIAELPYLQACVDETLRLYPTLAVITREVVENYAFPSGLVLEKGIRVHIPLYHLQHNPEFFPEPEEYRPERFLGEQKRDIKPYTYMPFGEGPRICIGMRFAKMQVTAGLITLLKKYRLALAPGMPRSLVFDPKSLITRPIGGIRLNFVKREGWEKRLLKA